MKEIKKLRNVLRLSYVILGGSLVVSCVTIFGLLEYSSAGRLLTLFSSLCLVLGQPFIIYDTRKRIRKLTQSEIAGIDESKK